MGHLTKIYIRKYLSCFLTKLTLPNLTYRPFGSSPVNQINLSIEMLAKISVGLTIAGSVMADLWRKYYSEHQYSQIIYKKFQEAKINFPL